jgi:hypothetical protein
VGFSLQSLTRTAGIQKHPDEIKHPGVAYLLLSMAFIYQRAHKAGGGAEKRLR